MSAPWSVQFRPSPTGTALVAAAHLTAACAAFVALPVAAALVCAGGVALSLGAIAGRMLQVSRWSVLGLELRPDGDAGWLGRDGTWRPAVRLAGVALAPWLVVVALRDQSGRTLGLVVLPDAAEPGEMRRLRMWLRWRPMPAGAGAGGGATVGKTGEKPYGELN